MMPLEGFGPWAKKTLELPKKTLQMYFYRSVFILKVLKDPDNQKHLNKPLQERMEQIFNIMMKSMTQICHLTLTKTIY